MKGMKYHDYIWVKVVPWIIMELYCNLYEAIRNEAEND